MILKRRRLLLLLLRPACPLKERFQGGLFHRGLDSIPPFRNCNNDQAVIIPTQNPLFQLNWEENGGEDAIDLRVPDSTPFLPQKKVERVHGNEGGRDTEVSFA
ncbi:hypothetical protein CDAR_564581 [Caerostris darwini]|uniref:Uncharacterized protein n=1 Tax=Caerostris darwini TaxID=1538125 RepID=A0AAV4THD4_9ARAC|nr:hypothetical protein CDAR_564581 [Caerostris darwini]